MDVRDLERKIDILQSKGNKKIQTNLINVFITEIKDHVEAIKAADELANSARQLRRDIQTLETKEPDNPDIPNMIATLQEAEAAGKSAHTRKMELKALRPQIMELASLVK